MIWIATNMLDTIKLVNFGPGARQVYAARPSDFLDVEVPIDEDEPWVIVVDFDGTDDGQIVVGGPFASEDDAFAAIRSLAGAVGAGVWGVE